MTAMMYYNNDMQQQSIINITWCLCLYIMVWNCGLFLQYRIIFHADLSLLFTTYYVYFGLSFYIVYFVNDTSPRVLLQ